MFQRLKDFTKNFAEHQHVEWWLFCYAVIESVFFPIPPDVLLVALALAKPQRAQRYAIIAAVGSVVGGVVGYAIGRYGFDLIARPVLMWFCDAPTDLVCPDVFMPKLEALFDKHGPWFVGVSAMSPIIPYRFTILAAGAAQMAFIPFIAVSLAFHWFRYATVSAVAAKLGPKAQGSAMKRVSLAFLLGGALLLAIYAAVQYFKA